MPNAKAPGGPTHRDKSAGTNGLQSTRPESIAPHALGNQATQHLMERAVRAPQDGAPPANAQGIPASVARSLSDSGTPLAPAIREQAESLFGADLGAVRVHSGAGAAKANQDLEAHAFSVGSNIVLGTPASATDPRLMTHEIAHALQPAASRGAPTVSRHGSAAEHEANVVAMGFSQAASPQRTPAAARISARRDALIHRDARHPTAGVFDAGYLLYALDGTDYDNATQHYYLSPWDRAHLQRMHGLYLMQTGTVSVITPPEIRRAAGGAGVLITLGPADLVALSVAGPAGAAQWIINLAQSRLGVSVPSVTLSGAGNEDFTRSVLPSEVARTLRSPLEGVDASQSAGVEAARARAAATSQDRTLSLENLRGEVPPMQDIGWSDTMDVNTLASRDDAGLADWYVQRLASLQAQLLESARAHHLPMQLLAAVILNELADINALDVLQSGPSTFRGSLGIAQIQIDTARRDNLVDLPAGAHRTGWRLSGAHAHDIDDPTMVDMGQRLRVGQLLQVPQIAIEAAAREIEMLLTRMAANRTQPWQVDHAFNATGPQGDAIYTQVGTGNQMEREGTLADAVCGAYNSPDVITASNTSTFSNARIHGANANGLAQDLYRFRLYRSA